MEELTPQEKRKRTAGQLDAEAARLLDRFYTRLRYWSLRHHRPCVTLPTWDDIRAARVLVRMKSLSREELYDKMEQYFQNLDELLEQQPAVPSFTHFLNSTRKIVGGGT